MFLLLILFMILSFSLLLIQSNQNTFPLLPISFRINHILYLLRMDHMVKDTLRFFYPYLLFLI